MSEKNKFEHGYLYLFFEDKKSQNNVHKFDLRDAQKIDNFIDKDVYYIHRKNSEISLFRLADAVVNLDNKVFDKVSPGIENFLSEYIKKVFEIEMNIYLFS